MIFGNKLAQNLHVVGAGLGEGLPVLQHHAIRHCDHGGDGIPEGVPAHAIPVGKAQLAFHQHMKSGFGVDADKVNGYGVTHAMFSTKSNGYKALPKYQCKLESVREPQAAEADYTQKPEKRFSIAT